VVQLAIPEGMMRVDLVLSMHQVDAVARMHTVLNPNTRSAGGAVTMHNCLGWLDRPQWMVVDQACAAALQCLAGRGLQNPDTSIDQAQIPSSPDYIGSPRGRHLEPNAVGFLPVAAADAGWWTSAILAQSGAA
jgi:hypothetical protein